MTNEEILSLFYDNVVYKKNEYGWSFKENLSFFKAKILNFDLHDSKNGKIVVSKGTKVNQKIINDLKKKNITNVTIKEESLLGFFISSDIIDEKTGKTFLKQDMKLMMFFFNFK